MKNLNYTMFDRIADSWQMDNVDSYEKWTEQQVITAFAEQCADFEQYTIEANCEAIVLWVDHKIAALALNDNELADTSDAEQYIRDHEKQD